VREREFIAGTLVALALLGTAASSAGHPGSGVSGQVLVGPTCPVERPAQSCVKPYQGTLRFKRARSGVLVRKLRTDPDGRFALRLSPGRYVIEAVSGHPYPRGSPKPLLVRRHKISHVRIILDSGIR
jgi:hypothetical protein